MAEEHFVVEEEEEKKEDNEEEEQKLESEGWAVFRADGIEFQLNLEERVERERREKDAQKDAEMEDDDDDEDAERYYIGESGLLDTNHARMSFIYHILIQFKSAVPELVNHYKIYMLETVVA